MTAAIAFLALPCLLLPLAGLLVFRIAPLLAAGDHRTYAVLLVNHLLTLGWGMMVAMGALHQMFPAILGASRRLGPVVPVQFGITTLGIALLLGGFARAHLLGIAGGAVLVLVGVVLFVGLLLRAVPQGRPWSPAATGILLSLACLLLTVLWGTLMALNWILRFSASLYTAAGIGVHAALGLGGWFVQLIMSVSYVLLPRFTGVRAMGEERLGILLLGLNGAVGLLVWAALRREEGPARAGVMLLSLVGLWYAADLVRLLRGARQRAPDLGNWHWWAIAGEVVTAAMIGLAWAMGLLPVEGRRLAVACGTFVLCGWVTLAIMGQLYKVTPFLMWHYRYARGLEATEIPRLAAPYFPGWGVVAFGLTAAGSALLPAAVLVGAEHLARVAGAGWALGAGIYSWWRARRLNRCGLRIASRTTSDGSTTATAATASRHPQERITSRPACPSCRPPCGRARCSKMGRSPWPWARRSPWPSYRVSLAPP